MGHSNILVSLANLRGLDVAELKEEDMPILDKRHYLLISSIFKYEKISN